LGELLSDDEEFFNIRRSNQDSSSKKSVPDQKPEEVKPVILKR